MTHDTATTPPFISYTGGDLDRADALRRNPGWIAEQLALPSCRLIPLWRDRHFVDRAAGHPELSVPNSDALRESAQQIVFLGLRDRAPLFAVDLSAVDEEVARSHAGGHFAELRELVGRVPAADAALLAYARGVLQWHRAHQFCSSCGGTTESRRGGHMRACLDVSCGREWFPVTSPAVIMLVVRPDSDGRPRCLLARHAGLARGVYSTIAGFVETGESLEEAVIREVHEETGIRAGNVEYRGSQPWPFSSSIMLAFLAEGLTEEITVDREELQEACWFSADEVRTFGDWYDAGAERRLPRRDSIARFLIDTWVAENASAEEEH